MASDTMESAISAEVEALRVFVQRKTDQHHWELSDRQFILGRLDNIQQTLEEGDPL